MASDKLWEAISNNNLKEIHEILSTASINLNTPHAHVYEYTTYSRSNIGYVHEYTAKGTFLQRASVSGSPVVACALVKAGANVNACGIYKGRNYEYSTTALILAVMQRKVDLVKKLLHRCGADVNATHNAGLAPLHYVVKNAHFALHDDYSSSPFKVTESTEKQEEIGHILLAAGATVDLQDKKGWTALHIAAKRKDSVLVKILLQQNAGVDIQDSEEMTPLHIATNVKDVATVQLLLQHGATVDIQNKEGMTPLHNATKEKDVATVQLLLQHGARVDIQNSEGMTPLHLLTNTRSYMSDSEKSDFLATAKILLQYHARADIPNNMGLTSLHNSIHARHTEMCKLLIQDSGPNSSAVVNIAENDGTTPLYAVIQALVSPGYGEKLDESLVKLLIEKGANLEATKDHLTPLHLAVDGGLLNVVKLLVEAGADIHAETPNTGLTPLDMAEHGGNQDIIDYLTTQEKSQRERNKREEASVEQEEKEEEPQKSDTPADWIEFLEEGAVGGFEKVLVIEQEEEEDSDESL